MENVYIEKLTEEQIAQRGIRNWPIWEKEISRFPWEYDVTEECYILEGEIIVETSEGKYHLGPGDFVTFRKGLQCTWDIRKPVRKHYNFRV